MGLTGENHLETMAWLEQLEAGIALAAPSGVSQGSIGYGAGGPVWLDDYKSKRPPVGSELVNAYKAVAYACVNINANAVAKVPLRLYCKTSSGQAKPRFWETRRVKGLERRSLLKRIDRSKVTRGMADDGSEIDEICNHPILDVLDCPNPYFDGNMLVQFLARSLDVIGVAYWYPDRIGPDYAPTEIWPLHSQYCYPTKGTGKQLIDHYLYFADRFAPEDLVRFRMISLRDPYLSGYAPLHACFEQLGLVGYYTGVVESMLKGGARPEAMIGPKDPNQPWTVPQQERIEAMVNQRFGSGKQGRIWTVDGSFDFHQLTYPPADLGSLQISKDARLIAANCFDVPISMLESESSNRAVASEGATQHQVNGVMPRCAIIASGLTHQVARRVDERLFLMFDDPVERNQLDGAKVHQVYIGSQVLTPNEVRAEIGYEPREGGDEVVSRPAPGEGKPGEKGDDEKKGDDK